MSNDVDEENLKEFRIKIIHLLEDEENFELIISKLKKNTREGGFLPPQPTHSDKLNLWNNVGFFYYRFDPAKSIRVYEELYDRLKKLQEGGQHYHKGMALHNLGIAFILHDQFEKGMTYLLYALTEDLLTAHFITREKHARYKIGDSHAYQVMQKFREKDQSYAVILPDIKKIDDDFLLSIKSLISSNFNESNSIFWDPIGFVEYYIPTLIETQRRKRRESEPSRETERSGTVGAVGMGVD